MLSRSLNTGTTTESSGMRRPFAKEPRLSPMPRGRAGSEFRERLLRRALQSLTQGALHIGEAARVAAEQQQRAVIERQFAALPSGMTEIAGARGVAVYEIQRGHRFVVDAEHQVHGAIGADIAIAREYGALRHGAQVHAARGEVPPQLTVGNRLRARQRKS